MAVNFTKIPSNIRVPLVYFEIDPSQAATYQQQTYALILGTHDPARGRLEVNRLTLMNSQRDAEGQCGVGSALARMCTAYFLNNQTVPLYVLAAAELPAWAAGSGAFEVAGTATDNGTIPLYIGGRLVRVYVSRGMDAEATAEAMVDAINADPALGAEAEVQDYDIGPPIVPWAALVTSTQPGVIGALDLTVAYRGAAYGEIVPPGLTVTAVKMTGATGVPTLATLLANLGDELFDYICCPWNDAASLDALDDLFQDFTGRWSPLLQLYGHAFAHLPGTVAQLSTFGQTRNGEHVTLSGINGCPTPTCEIAAAWTAQTAGSIIADPARPTQSLPLLGVMAPPPELRFTTRELQTLYFDGIAGTHVEGGVVRINRSITTYQRNVWGAPDNSYLDCETLYQLAYFNRFMRDRILLKYPRHKLANDGTRFGAGQAIVTPAIIKAEMIAAYGEMEEAGIMENMAAFKANIVVERNAQDPNRVDALLPPDLVNQLRIFAALNQFRLRSTPVEAA